MKIKKTICFSVLAGFYLLVNRPLAAQLPNGDNGNHKDKPGYKVETATEAVVVKDYKSFLEYSVKNEQLAAKTGKAVLLKPNDVIRLEKEGMEFSEEKPLYESADGRKIAYLRSDKMVAVVDMQTRKLSVFNNSGRLIKEGKLLKFKGEELAFSDTRLFIIGGMIDSFDGFDVRDYEGNLIKHIGSGYVDGYAVSNTQKYFAATLGSPKTSDYFILYDLDGNEIWRHEITRGGHIKIKFSPDDKYAVVKLPIYWTKPQKAKESEAVTKKRKLYVIDLERYRVISEENYEK